MRLHNIYDLSSVRTTLPADTIFLQQRLTPAPQKIFLLKFQKPDEKKQMVIDSGFRCHLTTFTRATAAAPSVFVAKLRKHLKTRRVTKVSQVGTDRILEFEFSEGLYKLYLEFFAAGNIILTDKDNNILTLLRIVPPGEGQEEQRVGLKYELDKRQNYTGIPELTKERVKEALEKAAEKQKERDAQVVGAEGKNKKKKNDELRKALAVGIPEYPPMLVDHAMRVTGFDSALKPSEVLTSDELLKGVIAALNEAQRTIEEITSKDTATGYIIAKKGSKEVDTSLPEDEQKEQERQNLLYEDFHPFKPRQFEDDPACIFLPFKGFNNTVDEFFSSIEGQKLESRLHERENAAKRKLEAAKMDQQKRLGGLQEIQTLNERKAEAVMGNVERVQEAMDAVNGLISQGIDWHEIGLLIEMEQKRKNPVAQMIKLPLKLQENTVTLLLDEQTFQEESDDEGDETESEAESSESDSEEEQERQKGKQKTRPKTEDKRLTIDINLSMTPWANANNYFDHRKAAIEKEQKTKISATKALKSTEQKVMQDLKKNLNKEKVVLRPIRKMMWFEKFTWFVSSDGYLVIGGRDAQQNEILYKKYLRKGDVYVHADLHGASSIVIRNKLSSADAPIPPSTLSQAGTLAVASSSAWDSKAGMSAWWVNADQVSKSAPTGEFLPTGSFMVRGKKNFLPPAQLVLGFGVLWMISEDSKKNHLKHRLGEAGDESGAATPKSGQEEQAEESDHEGPNASDEDIEEETHEESDDEQKPVQDEKDSDSDSEDAPPANVLQTMSLDSKDNKEGKKAEEEEEEEEEEVEEFNEEDHVPEVAEAEDEWPEEGKKGKAKGKSNKSQNQKHERPQVAEPKQKPANQLPRGKRSKAKKAAAKYALQDEEDRLAAQSLIGVSAGKAKADLEKEKKEQEAKELEFNRERRKRQHLRTQEEVAKTEAARQKMLEGGEAAEDGEEEHDDAPMEEESKLLEGLVGTLLPGDEVLGAVCTCAPWPALGRVKYKVKLQPGSVKKGKAVKEIIGRWAADISPKYLDERSADPEKVWPRELELIRGLRAEEVNGVVPVKLLKIVQSGGVKAKGGASKNGGKKGGRGRGSKK